MKEILYGLLYGVILGFLLIVVWYIWGRFYHRWYDNRIKNIMRDKYESKNKNKLDEDKYFHVADYHVDKDNLLVSGSIQLRDKASQNILASDYSIYKLSNSYKECPIYENSCIVV